MRSTQRQMFFLNHIFSSGNIICANLDLSLIIRCSNLCYEYWIKLNSNQCKRPTQINCYDYVRGRVWLQTLMMRVICWREGNRSHVKQVLSKNVRSRGWVLRAMGLLLECVVMKNKNEKLKERKNVVWDECNP